MTNGAVTLCAAAAGALLGAYCAFKFERNAKKKDQENADIAAVQETTLVPRNDVEQRVEL